jgi:hypothetical protein
MKTLEPQGFLEFRFPASDLDFDPFPGSFDRNLPESDVQLRVMSVGDSRPFFRRADVQLTTLGNLWDDREKQV